MMDIDTSSSQSPSSSPKQQVIASWTTDAGVSELSDDIFSPLQQKKKQRKEDSGEVEEDSPNYEKPQHHIDSTTPINQHICFNLIRHRGVSADPHSQTIQVLYCSNKKDRPHCNYPIFSLKQTTLLLLYNP
jgi:hypothetical protein